MSSEKWSFAAVVGAVAGVSARASSLREPVDVGALAAAAGLRLAESDLPANVPCTLGVRPDGGLTLTLRRSLSPTERRFAVAWGVANATGRRHLVGGGLAPDARYRTHLGKGSDRAVGELAAELLIPAAAVAAEPPGRRDGASLARRFGVGLGLASLRAAVLAR